MNNRIVERIIKDLKIFLKRNYLIIFTVSLIAVLVRVAFSYLAPATNEDAFITLRYSENLIDGKGLVYNIGERVQGFSSPIYTLVLALSHFLHLPAMAIGKTLNSVADGITAGLIAAIFLRYKMTFASVAAGLLYAFSATNVKWAVSGMETGIYICLIFLALYTWQRSHTSSFILAVLALLVRPDGAIVILVLLLEGLLIEKNPSLSWKEMVPAAVILAPWIIFAWLYYGSPIPYSIIAKKVVYIGHTMSITPNIMILLDKFFNKVPVVSPLLSIGFIIGCIVGWRKQTLRLIILWTILYLVSFALSKTHLHGWYLAPPLAGYITISLAGWFGFTLFLRKKWTKFQLASELRVFQVAALVAMILIITSTGLLTVKWAMADVRRAQNYEDLVREPLGRWLRDNTPTNSTIALEPIGYIGYYSERRILDAVGLVSPQVIKFYLQGNQPGSADLYLHFKPDYVVLYDYESPLRNPSFLEQYKKIALFSCRESDICEGSDLIVLQRRN